MVNSRLHVICGNCGCNDMFEYEVEKSETDEGSKFTVSIHCNDCSTIHFLDKTINEKE